MTPEELRKRLDEKREAMLKKLPLDSLLSVFKDEGPEPTTQDCITRLTHIVMFQFESDEISLDEAEICVTALEFLKRIIRQ